MELRHLERAIELSELGMRQGLGGPFGAVIVRGDQVLAEACNRVTSQNDPTAHAEVGAIRRACSELATFSLAGCEIYSSCEPCPMCLSAIHWARLDRLYYAATRDDAAAIGFDDALLYEELDRDPAARRLPTGQALRDAAQRVMAGFQSLPPERRY